MQPVPSKGCISSSFAINKTTEIKIPFDEVNRSDAHFLIVRLNSRGRLSTGTIFHILMYRLAWFAQIGDLLKRTEACLVDILDLDVAIDIFFN